MTAEDRRFEIATGEDSRTSSADQPHTETRRDSDLVGAEAAMHRAAQVARQRAAEVSENSAARPPVEHRDKSQDPGNIQDIRRLTFSQAQGYEEVPGPLKLEDLSREARTHIWNVFYVHLEDSVERWHRGGPRISGLWEEILRQKHLFQDHLPVDEWSVEFGPIHQKLRNDIETMPFNKVFDLIQFVFRRPECPAGFVTTMKRTFEMCHLAYRIDEDDPPTIVPAVTSEEGSTIVESLRTLRRAGLHSSATHLREASDCINQNDWAGSIRESIHAVESVARQIAPEKTDTLTQALNSIDKHSPLHSQLKNGIQALYWYTSDEQGVRHALLDREKASVGMDEAVFMLGACASFASYLWRKHQSGRVP